MGDRAAGGDREDRGRGKTGDRIVEKHPLMVPRFRFKMLKYNNRRGSLPLLLGETIVLEYCSSTDKCVQL